MSAGRGITLALIVMGCLIEVAEAKEQAMGKNQRPKGAPIMVVGSKSEQVVLPQIERPADLAFSFWERHRHQEILAANGFVASPQEWRRAAAHQASTLRVAAHALLAQTPVAQDRPLFQIGLKDIDASVVVWSALALVRLGDVEARKILVELAGRDVETYLAAPLAAGMLGALGDPRPYAAIRAGMNSRLDAIRVWAIKNAFPFAPLDGRADASGKPIDIWALYKKALADPDSNVQYVALAQIEELGSARGRPLLDVYLRGKGSWQERARAVRGALRKSDP